MHDAASIDDRTPQDTRDGGLPSEPRPAAVDLDVGAVDEAGGVGREEYRGLRDLPPDAEAAALARHVQTISSGSGAQATAGSSAGELDEVVRRVMPGRPG